MEEKTEICHTFSGRLGTDFRSCKRNDWGTYLNIAQLILAIALILAVLLQVRGGGLGGIFGQPDTVFRTKRGVERTLFHLTIILAVLFVIVSVITLKLG